jgi:hypothetical protein
MPALIKRNTFLVGISVVNIEDLPKEFLIYDTGFFNKKTKKVEYYELPKKGKFIILMLFTKDDGVWTTIRRWIQRKEDYYRSLIGQEVEIVTPYENN